MGCSERKYVKFVLKIQPVLTETVVQAEGLVNFWQENFRVQVEARSGALRIHDEDGQLPIFVFAYLTHSVLDEAPRAKRRKTIRSASRGDEAAVIDGQVYPDNNMDLGMDWGFGINLSMHICLLLNPYCR